MQILLADAKIMQVPDNVGYLCSEPAFLDIASSFAKDMLEYDLKSYSEMFSCSDKIALQTKAYFLDYFETGQRYPAIMTYYGQAYKHLMADQMTSEDLVYAERHLLIASFFYGILRPLNAISRYRMVGNLTLPSANGLSLPDFWKPKLTDYLINAVKADDGILLHLATEEYQHIFDWRKVCQSVDVVQPLFYVKTGKGLKMQAVWAKTCRGAMARYILLNRVKRVEDLYNFSYEGFTYNPSIGEYAYPHFVRQ